MKKVKTNSIFAFAHIQNGKAKRAKNIFTPQRTIIIQMLFLSNLLAIDTSIAHIRPRFKIIIPHKKEDIMKRLYVLLENSPKEVVGKIIDNHIILDIVEEEMHYWSPQLNFRVEQDELDHNCSVVSGLIGPRPSVWTMFMFIYFSIGLIGFIVSSIGVSKMLLGEYSNLILAFSIAILVMLSAYKTGKYGEQLAND